MDEPFGRLTTVFVLDLDNEAEALKLAKEIAAKTGRAITVRHPDGVEIKTVFPTRH